MNPDLLFVADLRNASILTELKSGTFNGFEQLDRLKLVSPKDLVRYGRLPVRPGIKLSAHRISLIEVVNTEFVEEHRLEFERIQHSACLVMIDLNGLRIAYGSMPDEKADRRLREGISFAGFRMPTKLLPLLPTAQDRTEVANVIADAVRRAWVNSERQVTSARIAELIFGGIWGRFDNEVRTRFLRESRTHLKNLATSELHDYMRLGVGADDQFTLTQLPDSIDQKQRTKHFQSFQRRIAEYKERQRRGESYSNPFPLQPSFFEDA